jgi:Transposase IS116/IS110/IS902 family
MSVPGVGPVVALTYRASVDVPARFRDSRAVGAVFGLTPSKYQSGESERTGGISRCGDEMMRVMLYEAAQILLTRSAKWSWLKAWAMQIARRRGLKKAIVALARRLAVIMHRTWVDGPSSSGPGKKPQQHESRSGSTSIGEKLELHRVVEWCPRGTMDEVSSDVRLDLPSLDGKADPKIAPPHSRIP